jgi:hypothetical protein
MFIVELIVGWLQLKSGRINWQTHISKSDRSASLRSRSFEELLNSSTALERSVAANANQGGMLTPKYYFNDPYPFNKVSLYSTAPAFGCPALYLSLAFFTPRPMPAASKRLIPPSIGAEGLPGLFEPAGEFDPSCQDDPGAGRS